MKIQDIVHVDFSEKELIILYNYIPRIIEKSAILVNLSPHYYTNDQQEILLTEDTRGNYWIIPTDYDVYWLFPAAKVNGRIKPHINDAFNLLFEFQNSENSNERELILNKPAKVYPARSRDGWMLEEVGFVVFGNSSLSSIETLNSKVNKLPLNQETSSLQISREQFEDYINKIQLEINQLKAQVQNLTQAREQIKTEIQEIKDNYNNLENKLPQIQENNSSNNQNNETKVQEITSNQHEGINISARLNLTSEELRIVETYNSNPVIISQQARQVSEPSSSIENRSRDSNATVVLERQPQGNYWLIGRDILYLMPKKGFNLNTSTVDTFKALFKCQGAKVTTKFKLIKPAKVAMIGNSQSWQLIERGIIEFE